MAHFSGRTDGRIIFVGDALTEADVRANKPFVGIEGQILEEVFSTNNIGRDDNYLTNVFDRCLYGKLNAHLRFPTNAHGTVFESEAFKQARERVLAEIKDCKSRVVVPLGRIPFYALYGDTRISAYRGSPLVDSAYLPDKVIIPTFHPSSVMYGQPINKFFMSMDMRKAIRIATNPTWQPPTYNLQFLTEASDAIRWLKAAHQFNCLGFDIEIVNHELSCFSLAYDGHSAVCIPLVQGYKSAFTLEEEAAILTELAQILEAPEIKIVGQNLVFDVGFMHFKYGIVTTNIEDTMIAQAVTNSDFPRGLDMLTSMYTDQVYYKDEGKSYFGDVAADEKFWRYNCLDSIMCMQIWPQQENELQFLGNFDYYRTKVDLINPLVFMQNRGAYMDMEALSALRVQAQQELRELKQQVCDIVGFDMNPNSDVQIKEYFYATKGVRPYLKDGKPCVDHDAMVRIALQGYPEASLINQYRSQLTRYSTFYDMTLDTDKRLRCSFNPVGAESRLSSRKTVFGTGANMQNQPREMKKVIAADPGYGMVSIDLGQAENRCVAFIGGCTEMMDAFNRGIDIHKKTAGLVFAVELEDVSDEAGSTDIGGGKYSQRDIGKRANHSLNYDIGIDTFAIKNEMSQADARFIKHKYYQVYPEVGTVFQEDVRQELRKGRVLTNLFGRTRQYYGVLDSKTFREAYSYKPQSTIGDLMNTYGIQFAYYHDQWFSQFILVNSVHDSIVLQFPLSLSKSYVAEAIMRLKESLERTLEYGGRKFSIPADLTLGFNMKGQQEFKSHAYTSAGRLAGILHEVYGSVGDA